jgi:hypothetical protein
MADTRQRAGGQDHRRRGEEPESNLQLGFPGQQVHPADTLARTKSQRRIGKMFRSGAFLYLNGHPFG